jgi:hypothetical protein
MHAAETTDKADRARGYRESSGDGGKGMNDWAPLLLCRED